MRRPSIKRDALLAAALLVLLAATIACFVLLPRSGLNRTTFVLAMTESLYVWPLLLLLERVGRLIAARKTSAGERPAGPDPMQRLKSTYLVIALLAVAVAVTEVGLAFLAANLITGSIWGRVAWGIWWTWDARLTSALVCWLLYAGYLMLRRAIEEPTQRATFAAVFSIFAFIDVPIVIFSIKWWRTQHPQPVMGGGESSGLVQGIAVYDFVLVINQLYLGASDLAEHIALEGQQRAKRVIESGVSETRFVDHARREDARVGARVLLQVGD